MTPKSVTHGSVGNDLRVNDYHIRTTRNALWTVALLVVKVRSLALVGVLIIDNRKGGSGGVVRCKGSTCHSRECVERHDNGGKIQRLRMTMRSERITVATPFPRSTALPPPMATMKSQ